MIATRIEHGAFFPAEAYHQDFARKNPLHPYIVVNDRPKVAALRPQYPAALQGLERQNFTVRRAKGDKWAQPRLYRCPTPGPPKTCARPMLDHQPVR